MPAIHLVFKKPRKTGNPVELVFGDDGSGSGIADRTLGAAARMPGLRGHGKVHVRKDLVGAARMPGMRGRGTVRYNTDTARPLVASVMTRAQEACALTAGLSTNWDQTDALQTGWQNPAQEAAPMQHRVAPSWKEVQRIARGLASQFQQALPLQPAPVMMRWQDAQRLRHELRSVAQDAVQTEMGLQFRFEDGLRDRRLLVRTQAQEATGLQMGITTSAGPAMPLYLAHQVRYQQAMYSPAGRSESKPPEPERKGCYEQLVGGPIELVFCRP